MELPEAVIEAGEKLAVTPVGNADVLKATAPVKLFNGAIVAEKVVAPPA